MNYNAHPATENLGSIASTKDGALGLVLHDTMAFNRERTPLGLLDIQCWGRDPNDFGKKHRRNELPIEQKESHKWLVSHRAVVAAQKRCPETTFVSVGDREADIYELFHEALSDPAAPKLLVRAEPRLAGLADGQGHLWDHVKGSPWPAAKKCRCRAAGNGRRAWPRWKFALPKCSSSLQKTRKR